MANRLDAQLNLYFGEGTDTALTHSQSQAQIVRKLSTSSSPLSSDDLNGTRTAVTVDGEPPQHLRDHQVVDDDDDDEDETSSIYSDDIYNVVAWQLGHHRAGSVSDGAAIGTDHHSPNHSKSHNTLSTRKGLKWYKKLFRLKRLQNQKHSKLFDVKLLQNATQNEAEFDDSANSKNGSNAQNGKSMKRSQSTANLTPFQFDDAAQPPPDGFDDAANCKNFKSPKSIKLQSPTGRPIRFELLLYEKRGKSRYKLMDHKSAKCICSNARKFDTKRFLAKHRMSIDHELQLIQTIQHYKQVMLRHGASSKNAQNAKSSKTSKFSKNANFENDGDRINSEGDELHHDLSATCTSTSDSDISITIDTETLYDDEDCSSFDQRHTTTPRRNLKADSRFMRFEHIVHSVCHRYEQHTAHSPYLVNYASLRKKQQQIELFYRHKVADSETVALLLPNSQNAGNPQNVGNDAMLSPQATNPQNAKNAENAKTAQNAATSKMSENGTSSASTTSATCPLTTWSTGKSAQKSAAKIAPNRNHKTNRKQSQHTIARKGTTKSTSNCTKSTPSTSRNVPGTTVFPPDSVINNESTMPMDSVYAENGQSDSDRVQTDFDTEFGIETEGDIIDDSEHIMDDLNGYLSDNEADDENEDEISEDEPSEDDSDASMDSVTLKQILIESQRIQKKAKKQRKATIRAISRTSKTSKTSKISKSSKCAKNRKFAKCSKTPTTSKESKSGKSTKTVALKPPSKSTQNSSSPSGNSKKSGKSSKSKTSRKLKDSKRKRLKKRKRRHVPRFMKSKSATPRRAHKLKTCDMNSASTAVREAANSGIRSHVHSEHVLSDQSSKQKRSRKRRKSFVSLSAKHGASTGNAITRRATVSGLSPNSSKNARFFGAESAEEFDGDTATATSTTTQIGAPCDASIKCKLQRLSSPQYLRLKSRDSLAKAIPLKLLSLRCETEYDS